jgi:hypothetical protein
MPPRNAGTSIGATSARALSKSAPAFPFDEDPGAGLAASIPALIRASMRTARRRPSKRPASIRRFLSKRTEADFQAWRDQQDWTARKYALWDAGKRLPPNEWEPRNPCSRTDGQHRHSAQEPGRFISNTEAAASDRNLIKADACRVEIRSAN